MRPTTIEDFHSRHDVLKSGCWRWTGHIANHGYGVFGHKRRDILAHRLSYELHVGPIPDGLVIDHLCRNTWCVNPSHLEPVTLRENFERAPGYGQPYKTHCPRGHEYSEANTYVQAKTGGRFCRSCRNISSRLLRATRRAAKEIFR